MTYLGLGLGSNMLLSEFTGSSNLNGTVTYNGQEIQVVGGKFTLNGAQGSIDAAGNYVLGNQTGNILSTEGVSRYCISGQRCETVTPTSSAVKAAPLIISGKNRHGQDVNIDLNYLAQSLKNGAYDTNNPMTKSFLRSWFSEQEINEVKTYVDTHSTQEVAVYLSKLAPSTIMILDEFRPKASPGAAIPVGAVGLARMLQQYPESWQNTLEYAGIPFTNADLDRFYRMSHKDFTAWLASLTTEQAEKVQGYALGSNNAYQNSMIATGWQDKISYTPELGRVVSPVEKDAIARIKFYVVQTLFVKSGGQGELTELGKTKQGTDGAIWKTDAFKEYLTEAAITDYVNNPQKGVMAGGTNGVINWTTTNTTTNTTTPTATNQNGNGVTATGTAGNLISGNTATTTGTTTPTTMSSTLSPVVLARIQGITDNIISKGSNLAPAAQIKFLKAVVTGIENIARKPEYLQNQDVQEIVRVIKANLQAKINALSSSSEVFESQIQQMVNEAYSNSGN